MLESKIYTPRSSFDTSREPVGFLKLPAELRIRIYEYSFANIGLQPLFIKRYPGHPWLYRQPKCPNIPPILLINRQIYYEAREVLHKVCFNSKDQPIVIEHVQYDYSSKPLPRPRDWNGICGYRSVREIAPVLKSLPRIRLDVVLCGSFDDQVLTITLLRWIRAVLNSRPLPSSTSGCHVPLKTLDVIFRLPWDQYRPKETDGLVRAVTGISAVVGETQVWSSWPTNGPVNRTRIKVEAGNRLDISSIPSRVEETEASTWEGMKRAWRRAQVEESPRIRRRELDRLGYVSLGQRLGMMGEKLAGTFRLHQSGDGFVGR